MSYSSNNIESVAIKLSYESYLKINHKYGIKSTSYKPYHNALHAQDVAIAAVIMARLAIKTHVIHPDSEYLLRIAGAYHDYDHSHNSGESERISAEAALNAMSKYTIFTDDHFNLVQDAILATVMQNINGIMSQSTANKPFEAHLLADADLATLGQPTPHFWNRALCLYEEYYPGKPPHGEAWQQFNNRQLGFIANHSYHTIEASTLFPHKPENIASIHQAIALDRIPVKVH